MEDGTIIAGRRHHREPVVRAERARCCRARACWCSSRSTPRRSRSCWRAPRQIEGKPLPLDAEARASLDRAWPTATAAPRSPSPRKSGAPRARARRSTPPRLQEVVQRRAPIYDKSAGRPLQSDLGAAQVGARLRSRRRALLSRAACSTPARTRSIIARRLVRMAIEDIGLADPQALVIANAAKDAYDFLGSPEGELAHRARP